MSCKKMKGNEYVKIASYTFLIAILMFVCIYFLDITDAPSKWKIVNSEKSKEWLNYSVSYFGTIVTSFIGFIGAIMAVSLTMEKQNEFRKEDSRKNVLPLIKVKTDVKNIESRSSIPIVIEYAKDDQTPIFISLSFENVGQREMYDVWVGGVKYDGDVSPKYCKIAPILYKGDKYDRYLASAIKRQQGVQSVEIIFRIYFRDCYNNWYYQEIVGGGNKGQGSGYKIDTFTIKSAPILVDEEKLPRVIKL